MKVHFQIAECSPLYQKKEGRGDFRKNLSSQEITFKALFPKKTAYF